MQHEEEIALYTLQEQIDTLRELELTEQEKQLRLELIGRWKESEEIDIGIVVARAWNGLVHILANQNQEQRMLHEVELFRNWMQGKPHFEKSVEIRWEVFGAMNTKALWWMEQSEDSVKDQPEGINGSCVEADISAKKSQSLSEVDQKLKQAVWDIVEQFSDDPEEQLRHHTASWLYNLGYHQRMNGCYMESKTSYQTLWKLFREDPSSEIAEDLAARGMMNLGYLLLNILDCPEEATMVYEEVIRKYPRPDSKTMKNLLSKIYASHQMAVTQLSKRGQCTKKWADVAMQEEERKQFRSWIEEADALQEQERYKEAIEKYAKIISCYPDPKGAELRMKISDAMTEQAYCMQMLGKWEESLGILNVHLEEFEAELHMMIEKDVAMNLFNKSVALQELDRYEEQIDCLQKIIGRWSDSDVPDLIYHCAKAGWVKGDAEEDGGQLSEAEQSYRQTVRYLEGETEEIAVVGATACINLAMLLDKKGNTKEALLYLDQVLSKQNVFSTAMGLEELERAEQVRSVIEKSQAEKEKELRALAEENFKADQDAQNVALLEPYREMLSPELLSILARAYNNNDQEQEALDIYRSLEADGYEMKAVDYYRLAYAEFYAGKERAAWNHIQKTIEMDTEKEVAFAGELKQVIEDYLFPRPRLRKNYLP